MDGGSSVSIKELTLSYEKNLIRDHNLGTVEPEDILNQGYKITGSITLDYESRAYRDLMVDGTYKAMRIQLINTEVTIGASNNPEFVIDLSRVDFEAWEPSYPNDEIATQTFTFTALHDITTGKTINSLLLKNENDGSNY